MIKKLRIKSIIASAVSLFTVLVIIMCSISVLSYNNVVDNADIILAILAANDGKFPDSAMRHKDKFFPGDFQGKEHIMSPELPYETRYFTVFLNSNGSVSMVNTGKIAAVDTQTAIEYAQIAVEKGKTKGFINDYRYIVYNANAETHIIFLDCGRSLDNFKSYVFIGIAVSFVGLISVTLLMVFLSSRIVKPFLENYEKQKRFITDAGHELKTPLTIIDADTELLEMDYGENEWLKDIQAQTKRLSELTNSLILLSRMEEEQVQTQVIDFPLSDIAEETVETFKSLAKTQNKTLKVDIQPMISMRGDEKAIRQLMTILLDNAVKYSQTGGEISVLLESEKNIIKLCVYNTTDYMPKEYLSHLFDRFYRTDQSRNSQTGGYGLGLSIALAIVQAHKGKITATTKDEKSLQITAVFPK